MTFSYQTFSRATLLASMVLLFLCSSWLGSAQAGCQLNITVKNTGKAGLSVSNGTSLTGVKSKGGSWKGLKKGYWFSESFFIRVDPQKTISDIYSATFGCGAKRRYRIRYKCRSGEMEGQSFSYYYPSEKDWTKNQTVSIRLGRCK